MRCLLCARWSFGYICRSCRAFFLTPNPSTRELSCGLKVYALYAYSDIEAIIKTKYSIYGSAVLALAAKEGRVLVSDLFADAGRIDLVPLENRQLKAPYSHSCVIAKALAANKLKARSGVLLAQNSTVYTGKPLSYRQQNRRDFRLVKSVKNPCVLVDDVITTGTTLEEAAACMREAGKELLFAFVLADAAR